MRRKVLIADDEPKIRQGLRNTVEELGMPLIVCAEAKNGLDALELTEKFQPDILLVDICMPKLSGIRFLEELQKVDQHCKTIIISGFNEFSYAKQAIKLGVSDYLLKPISEEELRIALEKALVSQEKEEKSRKIVGLMNQQLCDNGGYLRDVFFRDWLEGKLTTAKWREHQEVMGIFLPERVNLILAACQEDGTRQFSDRGELEAYQQTKEKLVEEVLHKNGMRGLPIYVYTDRFQNTVAMEGVAENASKEEAEANFWRTSGEGMTVELQLELSRRMKELTGEKCTVYCQNCPLADLPKTYETLQKDVQRTMECKPLVKEAKKYIDEHYEDRNLDLGQVAHAIGCNSSYLSRVMKQELGTSFKDYLTTRRIQGAIHLMRDLTLSINQIAEKVGYSNQHYFSAAFKNCQGMSPSEYRKHLVG